MRAWNFVCVVLLVSSHVLAAPTTAPSIFDRDNLVAWCIVPYDGKQRGPHDRADMLQRLGLKHFAYDWRNQHLPTFDQELSELESHHIELTAVWFPDSLSPEALQILSLLDKHKIQTQLWVMSGATSVEDAANRIRTVAEAAAKIGCTVGLYNHRGWFGEPENQLAILDALKLPNVGMVYNLHHGHDHVDRFTQVLPKLLPHLMCINVEGMSRYGDDILPIGRGELDLPLLKIIKNSGYRGRIGIINETQLDAEVRLKENIDALATIDRELDEDNYWSVESAAARERLPIYLTIPAAKPEELTPANGWPETTEQWPRSHGGDACQRFSPLTQIDRGNVKSLKVAWVYHSNDAPANVQCNPIIVDGVMYAPTSGNHVVAINAATGEEIWRFTPNAKKPAARGLTYFAGDGDVSPRVLFAADDKLWAIDPKTGQPISSFGDGGKIAIIDCAVAPAIFKHVLIYPGWNRDVFGVDLATGKPIWTFHTIPHTGEPFADTWDKPEEGANCWGGMAIDSSRGIAYVTTGSPKPNFLGSAHLGDNLFGDCVLAIDVLTGNRLWHFQEIRHDIWDLDIPAPPMLVTVTREGKRVDAVAAVTKIGNTLLLDRLSGKPLFPFRLRRAPTSKLPGERTAAYQPDLELPEPFARNEFALDDITDISPAAHRFVLDQIQRGQMTYGWFRPFDEGKPLVELNVCGGAEWTGASFDQASGMLYVSANHFAWTPSVHRFERPTVDETKLPPTTGRLVYEHNCMPCHGPNREGMHVSPSLLGLSERLKESDVRAIWKTGRGAMPSFAAMAESDQHLLLDYLFERDRTYPKPTTRPKRPGYRDNGYPRLMDAENYPGCKPPWGTLVAINLNTGKIAWRVPLGEDETLMRRGVPKTGTENFGGPTATASGLIFCAGTRDKKIRAFDSATGEELWSATLPFGGFAPPSVYEAGGKEYVVIAATGGGKLAVPPYPGPTQTEGDAYVAFSLP